MATVTPTKPRQTTTTCPAPGGELTAGIAADAVATAYAAADQLVLREKAIDAGPLPRDLLAEMNGDICALRAHAASKRAEMMRTSKPAAKAALRLRADQSDILAVSLEMRREHHDNPARALGRSPVSWEAERDAITSQLDAALGGSLYGHRPIDGPIDSAAQASVDDGLAKARDLIRRVNTENVTDTRTIEGMQTSYYDFIIRYNDKDAPPFAWSSLATLRDETERQENVGLWMSAVIDDAALLQLERDPRFASRGGPALIATSNAWKKAWDPSTEASISLFIDDVNNYASTKDEDTRDYLRDAIATRAVGINDALSRALDEAATAGIVLPSVTAIDADALQRDLARGAPGFAALRSMATKLAAEAKKRSDMVTSYDDAVRALNRTRTREIENGKLAP